MMTIPIEKITEEATTGGLDSYRAQTSQRNERRKAAWLPNELKKPSLDTISENPAKGKKTMADMFNE